VRDSTLHRWHDQPVDGGAARIAGVGSPKKVARERWRMKWQVANGNQFIG